MKIKLNINENEQDLVFKIKTVDAINPSFVKCNNYYKCKISNTEIIVLSEEGIFKKKVNTLLKILIDSVESLEYDDSKSSKLIIKWKDSNGRLLKSVFEGDIEKLVNIITEKQ